MTKNNILNLATLVFNDKKYNIIVKFLENNNYNSLRIFVSDRLEELEILFIVNKNNQILLNQLELCKKLDDYILDLCVVYEGRE